MAALSPKHETLYNIPSTELFDMCIGSAECALIRYTDYALRRMVDKESFRVDIFTPLMYDYQPPVIL